MTDLAERHDELRPLMFSIAYRMLGSVAEAEDVVQEAFLRMHKSALEGASIESPDAYATTVTTRLAIDALRSARLRRERYVGQWLPEPLLDDPDADPARRIDLDETVSMAFLAVLERLSPTERAVFLLREVFGYEFAEIARIIGKSEPNCRQQLVRARRHIDAAQPRFDPSPEHRRTLGERFMVAVRDGDLAGLESLLAEDVVFYGDGGGKAPAVLVGLARQGRRLGLALEPVEANGQPAVRVDDRDGALLGVLSLEVADDHVVGIRNQINPDKLRHLGPVGDLTELMRAGPA